jgi:hypothetical protein
VSMNGPRGRSLHPVALSEKLVPHGTSILAYFSFEHPTLTAEEIAKMVDLPCATIEGSGV